MEKKSTGIVRRIDKLGRLVIPKELCREKRIRHGDPLEIFTNNEDQIILEKYSALKSLSTVAYSYAKIIDGIYELTAAVCDTEKFIVAANDKQLVGKMLSKDLYQRIFDRKLYTRPENPENDMFATEQGNKTKVVIVASPIVAEGDLYGGLCLIADSEVKGAATQSQVDIVRAFSAAIVRELQG